MNLLEKLAAPRAGKKLFDRLPVPRAGVELFDSLAQRARRRLGLAPEHHEPALPHGRERVNEPRRTIVVGGGIAGIAAATLLAERGVRVTLVEAHGELGGRARSWPDRHTDGEPFAMERGFHGFFRQYYNLRALLRRVDPALSMLTPLTDYPLLAPGGRSESFTALPRLPLLNAAALVARTESMGFRDLLKVPPREALELVAFDHARTYASLDSRTARDYLEGLHFPARAKELLFDVFAHSFFNPDDDFSAAELLMMFHFYFMGNPEGLVFDVVKEPFGPALWTPFARYLRGLGADLFLGRRVRALTPRGDAASDGGVRVELEGGDALHGHAVVLAVDVKPLRALVAASPSLGDDAWRGRVAGLRTTAPFAVLRLWLDRPADPGRAPFAGTRGFGFADNVSLYHLFEGESARWAARTGGSVVELHAYAVRAGAREEDVRASLRAELAQVYPELGRARVVAERWLWHDDCPSFACGTHAARPGVATPDPRVVLAGDHVRIDLPTALMERAATTGFLAADALLARWGVRGERLTTVPMRGVFANFVK